jgi:acetolactate synthase I/II/III large subunit
MTTTLKLSDYIMQRLADWGTRHIFLVTGGGAMHLNDSIGKEHRIHYICNHHEQASAMAAEAYARITGSPGVVNVTTGPGSINALNGVFGAWTDSIPMLVVSGQVKRETCMATTGTRGLRQLGDQEVDIVRMVKGITKYAVLVDDPNWIRYHLERAWHLAKSGRPGPCWLDIPVDVQSAQIDEAALQPYNQADDPPLWKESEVRKQCGQVLARIRAAKRPVILAGTGVRLADALDEFRQLTEKLQIPVTTAWTHDLIASNDPLYCGRPGTIGDRAGNFTVQNADLILVLGSRLNVRQVSYNWQSFAPRAYKIQVDIDAPELDKPLVRPDLGIHSDLKFFLKALAVECDRSNYQPIPHDWLSWCRERVARYPVMRDHRRKQSSPLDPYQFMDQLSNLLAEDDVVICGDATACIVSFQVIKIRMGQRLISNSGSASMGYDLPAAVGAAVACNGGRVICMAGDGSLQLNIQELQTIKHHQLPVKLFVLNNGGYLSIRTTQSNFFEGRLTGSGPTSGVSFPDFVKVGCAYGIRSVRIESASDMPRVQQALDEPGPALIEVMLDSKQEFEPRIKSKQLPDGKIVTPALEDMYPFLDPEELASNIIKD